MTRTLFLCGAGNSEGVRLALAINAVQRRWDRLGVLDDDAARHGEKLIDVEIVGGFDALGVSRPEDVEVVNLVARTTQGRKTAGERIAAFGHRFAPLVQPAVDTGGVDLAADVTVYQNVCLSPGAVIEAECVFFMGAMVGQNARIGRGSVIAAGAGIGADAELGEGVYVGTRAAVAPGLKIGARATIGAASTVVEDVPPGATVVGVPGVVLLADAGGRSARSETNRTDARMRRKPPRAEVADLERAITGVWCELLGRPEVGLRDNFFDIGATSLTALRAIERIRCATHREIAQTDVFRFSTVQALAEHLCCERGTSSAARAGSGRAALRRARAGGRRRRRIDG